jgi:hypothetical protein
MRFNEKETIKLTPEQLSEQRGESQKDSPKEEVGEGKSPRERGDEFLEKSLAEVKKSVADKLKPESKKVESRAAVWFPLAVVFGAAPLLYNKVKPGLLKEMGNQALQIPRILADVVGGNLQWEEIKNQVLRIATNPDTYDPQKWDAEKVVSVLMVSLTVGALASAGHSLHDLIRSLIHNIKKPKEDKNEL